MAIPKFLAKQLMDKAEPFIKKAAESIVDVASGPTYFGKEPENRAALVQEVGERFKKAVKDFMEAS